MRERLKAWLPVCKFYGWTLDDVRSLSFDEFRFAQQYMVEVSKHREGG